MPHIVVNNDQAKIISEASGSVEIRDSDGTHLGYVAHGFNEHDISIAKERRTSDEPRYTTDDVLKHLESLEDK